MNIKVKWILFSAAALVLIAGAVFFLIPLPDKADIDDKFGTTLNQTSLFLQADRFENLIDGTYTCIGPHSVDGQNMSAGIKISKSGNTDWNFENSGYALAQESEVPFRDTTLNVKIYKDLYASQTPDETEYLPEFMIQYRNDGVKADIWVDPVDVVYTNSQTLTEQDQKTLIDLMNGLFPEQASD